MLTSSRKSLEGRPHAKSAADKASLPSVTKKAAAPSLTDGDFGFQDKDSPSRKRNVASSSIIGAPLLKTVAPASGSGNVARGVLAKPASASVPISAVKASSLPYAGARSSGPVRAAPRHMPSVRKTRYFESDDEMDEDDITAGPKPESPPAASATAVKASKSTTATSGAKPTKAASKTVKSAIKFFVDSESEGDDDDGDDESAGVVAQRLVRRKLQGGALSSVASPSAAASGAAASAAKGTAATKIKKKQRSKVVISDEEEEDSDDGDDRMIGDVDGDAVMDEDDEPAGASSSASDSDDGFKRRRKSTVAASSKTKKNSSSKSASKGSSTKEKKEKAPMSTPERAAYNAARARAGLKKNARTAANSVEGAKTQLLGLEAPGALSYPADNSLKFLRAAVKSRNFTAAIAAAAAAADADADDDAPAGGSTSGLAVHAAFIQLVKEEQAREDERNGTSKRKGGKGSTRAAKAAEERREGNRRLAVSLALLRDEQEEAAAKRSKAAAAAAAALRKEKKTQEAAAMEAIADAEPLRIAYPLTGTQGFEAVFEARQAIDEAVVKAVGSYPMEENGSPDQYLATLVDRRIIELRTARAEYLERRAVARARYARALVTKQKAAASGSGAGAAAQASTLDPATQYWLYRGQAHTERKAARAKHSMKLSAGIDPFDTDSEDEAERSAAFARVAELKARIARALEDGDNGSSKKEEGVTPRQLRDAQFAADYWEEDDGDSPAAQKKRKSRGSGSGSDNEDDKDKAAAPQRSAKKERRRADRRDRAAEMEKCDDLESDSEEATARINQEYPDIESLLAAEVRFNAAREGRRKAIREKVWAKKDLRGLSKADARAQIDELASELNSLLAAEEAQHRAGLPHTEFQKLRNRLRDELAEKHLTRLIKVEVPCTQGAFLRLMDGAAAALDKKTKVVADAASEDEEEEDKKDGGLATSALKCTLVRAGPKVYGGHFDIAAEARATALASDGVDDQQQQWPAVVPSLTGTLGTQGAATQSIHDMDLDGAGAGASSSSSSSSAAVAETRTYRIPTPFAYWLAHRDQEEYRLTSGTGGDDADEKVEDNELVTYTPATFAALPKAEQGLLWDAFLGLDAAVIDEMRDEALKEYVDTATTFVPSSSTAADGGAATHWASSTARHPASFARDEMAFDGTSRMASLFKGHHAAEYVLESAPIAVPSIHAFEAYAFDSRRAAMKRALALALKEEREAEEWAQAAKKAAEASAAAAAASGEQKKKQEKKSDARRRLAMEADSDDDETDAAQASSAPNAEGKDESEKSSSKTDGVEADPKAEPSVVPAAALPSILALRSISSSLAPRVRIGSYTATSGTRVIVADVNTPSIRVQWTPAEEARKPTGSSAANDAGASASGSWDPLQPLSTSAIDTCPGTITIAYSVKIGTASLAEWSFMEGTALRPAPSKHISTSSSGVATPATSASGQKAVSASASAAAPLSTPARKQSKKQLQQQKPAHAALPVSPIEKLDDDDADQLGAGAGAAAAADDDEEDDAAPGGDDGASANDSDSDDDGDDDYGYSQATPLKAKMQSPFYAASPSSSAAAVVAAAGVGKKSLRRGTSSNDGAGLDLDGGDDDDDAANKQKSKRSRIAAAPSASSAAPSKGHAAAHQAAAMKTGLPVSKKPAAPAPAPAVKAKAPAAAAPSKLAAASKQQRAVAIDHDEARDDDVVERKKRNVLGKLLNTAALDDASSPARHRAPATDSSRIRSRRA